MANFTKDMPVEQILESMNKNGGNTEIMHAGPCFLQYQLHKQLLDEQQKAHKELVVLNQKFQKDNLKGTTRLVIATWALVAATILLAFFHKG